VQPDRHLAHAHATPLTDRMAQGQGVLQPDGKMMQEARLNADDSAARWLYRQPAARHHVLFMR